jgi:predicted acyl esterase
MVMGGMGRIRLQDFDYRAYSRLQRVPLQIGPCAWADRMDSNPRLDAVMGLWPGPFRPSNPELQLEIPLRMSRRTALTGAVATAGVAAGVTSVGAWALPAPRDVEVIEHVWIAMADGVRLSARLFLPRGSDKAPVPAVLEYIPYRKRDAYRGHDTAWGHQLASHGIAYVRIDVRGSGDSEGVLVDEYDLPELNDGGEAIAWIAAQSWCSGAVGLRGISWGGINALQIAAMRPPALKAIMALGCSDNRYTNDAHYVGGALGHTNLQWGIGFKTVMAGPPDPAIVGQAWEAMWRQRLEATPAIMETWLRHQTFDEYWRRGSVALDWGAISVPTYLVGGWQDTYSNPIGRLLQNLKVPRKGLIGPWGHTYPWTAEPMSLDWTHEEVRWWRHWLMGEATGIMDEPMLRAFMPYATWSRSRPAEIPGRWIAEPAWPSRAIKPRSLHLTPASLADRPGPAHVAQIVGDRIVGLTKPEWLDRPPIEQSLDDKKSLSFESAVLDRDTEILGYPVAHLRIAADRPVAKVAVRITEVTADCKSWLVSYGLKNLTHRDSDAAPTPLKPGEFYDLDFPLFMVGHRFSKGSRIRVAISENLWPLAWPSPEIVTLKLALDHCRVDLPVRPRERTATAFLIPVRHAEPSKAPAPFVLTEPVSPGHYRIILESPPVASTLADTRTVTSRGRRETSEIIEGQANSGLWRNEASSSWARGDWDCSLSAMIELKSTATEFLVTESLTASKGPQIIFTRRSEARIPRQLV